MAKERELAAMEAICLDATTMKLSAIRLFVSNNLTKVKSGLVSARQTCPHLPNFSINTFVLLHHTTTYLQMLQKASYHLKNSLVFSKSLV